MSFGEDMDRLQAIMDRFESDDLDMEETLESFEEGVKLIRRCRQYLETARRKVTVLVEGQEVEGGIANE